MDDALFVSRFEGFRNLLRNRQRFVERERTLRNAIGERRPFDQLQHQRADAVGFLNAVDGSDVGMIQRSEDVSLAFESREPIRVECEELWQDLDGDIASEFCVARSVDLAL